MSEQIHTTKVQVRQQCYVLLKYALDAGKEVSTDIINNLEKSDLSLGDLITIYNHLSKAISPAKPKSIFLIEEQSKKNHFWQFLGPIPLVQKMVILSSILLIKFIVLSLSPDINQQTIQLGIFNSSGRVLLLNLLFILSSAGIGTTFSSLFKIQSFISNGTYDSKYESSYWINFILGLFAGIILAEMIPVETGDAKLIKPLLALLGGFSASLVYRILNRLVEAVESIFKGDPTKLMEAEKRNLRLEHEKKIAEEKMTVFHKGTTPVDIIPEVEARVSSEESLPAKPLSPSAPILKETNSEASKTSKPIEIENNNDCSCETLEQLIENKTVSSILKIGSDAKEDIQEAQSLMYELGFEKQLKWDQYGADGKYGSAMANAVRDFSEKNGIKNEGKSIDVQTAKMILKRNESLDELQQLNADLEKNRIEENYCSNSNNRIAVAALQTLLNDLGFGMQLNWAKYGADGTYGKSTILAVQSFAKRFSIASDGRVLSKKLAQLIIDQLKKFYGDSWNSSKVVLDKDNSLNSLTVYTGSQFAGKKLIADKEFVPALERINEYAKKHKVQVYITSSFRTTTVVEGAIVKPAKYSNHLIGHAIDMNVMYDNGQLCNSTCLANENLPAPVAGFIDEIRNDNTLRWGGDFNQRDVVHIDDGMNSDMEAWNQRYEITQNDWLKGNVT